MLGRETKVKRDISKAGLDRLASFTRLLDCLMELRTPGSLFVINTKRGFIVLVGYLYKSTRLLSLGLKFAFSQNQTFGIIVV